MGVGDLSVPKEMQRMGEAFYGRAQAYRAALATDDRRELARRSGAQHLRQRPGFAGCGTPSCGVYAGSGT